MDTFVYHQNCPKGKIVSEKEAKVLISNEGWVDSPAKIGCEECKEEPASVIEEAVPEKQTVPLPSTSIKRKKSRRKK